MGNVNCLLCNFGDMVTGNCTAVGRVCTAVRAVHCPLLRKYLDTGLTPEDVGGMQRDLTTLRTIIEECSGLDRVCELARADRDGRVVVLPCKVGDTVYWVHNKTITRCRAYRVQKNRKGIFICLRGGGKSYGAFRADLTIGKTIFLTREEAEEALRRAENG